MRGASGRCYTRNRPTGPTLEWRNWQTHGTQKPKHRITKGKTLCPLYALCAREVTQDNAHLPLNHYKTTTVPLCNLGKDSAVSKF
jgi:hypothetical protein